MRFSILLSMMYIIIVTPFAQAAIDISPTLASINKVACTDTTTESYISDIISSGYVTAEETTSGTSYYKLYYPANTDHALLTGQLYLYKSGNTGYMAISSSTTLSQYNAYKSVNEENTSDGTWYIKAYIIQTSDSSKGCILQSDNFTISTLPTLQTPYASPSSAVAGTNFKFYAPLSGSLPSGYSLQIEWYDGVWDFRKEMSIDWGNSTLYSIYNTITKAGSRFFRVAIFNGSTMISDWEDASFIVTEVPVNHPPVATKYSATTTAKVGETVTVKVTATDQDNNLATVQINWGDSATGFCSQDWGDIYQCTHTYQNPGTYSWRVTAYDHGDPNLTSVVTGSVDIQTNVPTLGTLSNLPVSDYAGTNFTFYASLSDSLPSGYSLQIEWYDGVWDFRKEMFVTGTPTIYSVDNLISKAGTRLYRVAIFNGTTIVSSWKEASFTVIEVPVNHAPTATLYSATTSAKIGETVIVRVTATDQDNNLGTVQMKWGDSGDVTTQCYQYSGDIYQCTHAYQNPGTYSWAVTAHDNGNPILSSNVVTGSVAIQSDVPTLGTLSNLPVSDYAGTTFTFYASLSDTLPTGYNLQIEWFDGVWNFTKEMFVTGTPTVYSVDNLISKAGNRLYRVAIFNGTTIVSAWKEASFTVIEVPVNHAPTATLYSATTSAKVGDTVTVKVTATDQDNNLGTVQMKWGDSGDVTTQCYQYSGDIYQCTHTYQNPGTYSWAVTAHDNGNPILSSNVVTGSIVIEEELDIVAFLNTDSMISRMAFSTNLIDNKDGISRSDAVILIDRMRILENSNFEKDMTEYLNPFADVPMDAEYVPSLMRLAYYHSSSFNLNAISKYNEFFNPLRQMSRQEFLKVALVSFNIPIQPFDLASNFTDSANMSPWAVKYFETAAYYGIILGNGGQLLAMDKILEWEALTILRRIKLAFGQNYPFDPNSFDLPEFLDQAGIYQKTIGVEYEPSLYKPEATPINISGITQSNIQTSDEGKEFIILSAVTSQLDISNGATDYYRWKTNAGYFMQSPNSTNFKEVYFYPASSQPLSSYIITVEGWDDLGFVSRYATAIDKTFSYPEDVEAVPTNEVGFDAFTFTLNGNLTATKVAALDFTTTHVTKSNIDLAIDHIVVELISGGYEYILFTGTPTQKQVAFIVQDIPSLYGQDVTLRITMYTQNVKHQKTFPVRYLPVFWVAGKIYNTGVGSDAAYITFAGEQVYLDESNAFFVEIDSSSERIGEELHVYTGSDSNFFQVKSIDLTYQSPQKYITLIGQNKDLDWDLDGVNNDDDAFPNDPTETVDTDLDGIGNNADTDDDNDGMSDEYEIAHGFDPLDASDAGDDTDGDGFTNLEEYYAGTDPLDEDDYPGSVSNRNPWALFLPAILSGTHQETPGETCGADQVYDCLMECVDALTAQAYIGDGYCDDGTWGFTLTCPAFNNDDGDCN